MIPTKLTIIGFKSFADKTELPLAPGLTCVVGPNGCGKSNILECFRWVMGESSARRLRGDDLDNVIFSGTDTRPRRDLAEATLQLAHTEDLPPPWNQEVEIRVTRRIRRGAGSQFLINDTPSRSRDLETLLVGGRTGSHSVAFVSQGDVDDIISARPAERRKLLEEAAGVRSLQTRRREAISRLEAAKINLLRVTDLLDARSRQVNELKRQARQTRHYRELGRRIQAAMQEIQTREARVLRKLAEAAQGKLKDADSTLMQTRVISDQYQRLVVKLRQVLEELREQAGRAIREREDLRFRLRQKEDERNRLAEDLKRQALLVRQAEEDRGQRAAELEEAKVRLDELARSEAELAAGPPLKEAALLEALEEARTRREDTEHKLADLREVWTVKRTEQQNRMRQIQTLRSRRDRILVREQDMKTQRGALVEQQQAVALPSGPLLEEEEAAEAALQQNEQEAEKAKANEAHEREVYREAHQHAQVETVEAQQVLAELRAEIRTLKGLIPHHTGEALSQKIAVTPGYELAVETALDSLLLLPISDNDQVPSEPSLRGLGGWANNEFDFNALPDGTPPLANKVELPDEFKRLLTHVGLAPSFDVALSLQKALGPGGLLVTLGGGLVRWDGLTEPEGVGTANGQSTTQGRGPVALRARLSQLEEAISVREKQELAREEQSRIHLAAREKKLNVAQAAARKKGESLSGALSAHNEIRRLRAEAEAAQRNLEQQQTERRMALLALDQNLTDLKRDLGDLKREANALGLEQLFDDAGANRKETTGKGYVPTNEISNESTYLATLETEIGAQENYVRERTRILEEATRNLEEVRRERALRLAKRTRIEEQRTDLNRTLSQSQAHLEKADKRIVAAQEEESRISKLPTTLDSEIVAHVESLDQKSRIADQFDQKIETALSEVKEAESEERRAQEKVASARETRASALSTFEEARTRVRAAETAANTANDPGAVDGVTLPVTPAVDPWLEWEDERLAMELERLEKRRDRLGSVNLRAEIDLERIQKEIAILADERDELDQAIGKLEQGIERINSEGQKRIRESFQRIQAEFSKLFRKIFRGGKAELRLIHESDPLAAGLEIIASPPGKRTQSLSLLSGGERTLTAVALLFSLLRTTRPPICVLDEVDAPLSDSNVNRLLDLVLELSDELGTRFLMVSHNRVTMARAHRLLGITMTERGVSRLLSVDFGIATRYANQTAVA